MELKILKEASERIISSFGISWDTLSQLAIRFCLSSEFIQMVLVGASNEQELDSAIEAASEGSLDKDKLGITKDFAIYEETLLNPSYWPIP
jgi:aryl-alcohol dehydrogenase-like predicted oxidoreductase